MHKTVIVQKIIKKKKRKLGKQKINTTRIYKTSLHKSFSQDKRKKLLYKVGKKIYISFTFVFFFFFVKFDNKEYIFHIFFGIRES